MRNTTQWFVVRYQNTHTHAHIEHERVRTQIVRVRKIVVVLPFNWMGRVSGRFFGGGSSFVAQCYERLTKKKHHITDTPCVCAVRARDNIVRARVSIDFFAEKEKNSITLQKDFLLLLHWQLSFCYAVVNIIELIRKRTDTQTTQSGQKRRRKSHTQKWNNKKKTKKKHKKNEITQPIYYCCWCFFFLFGV